MRLTAASKINEMVTQATLNAAATVAASKKEETLHQLATKASGENKRPLTLLLP